MLLLKAGVRITGLRPELLVAIIAAERVYEDAGHDLTLTACVDGKHMAGSFHYSGLAVDIRTNDVPAAELPKVGGAHQDLRRRRLRRAARSRPSPHRIPAQGGSHRHSAMSDLIGNITVPDIVASGTFPIVSDYPFGRSSNPDVVIHQFGSGNAKIEQRFLLGDGAKRFTVRRAWMNDPQRIALRNFWESKYGPFGAFTYNAPNDDGNGTTAYTCRFANEPLSWEMVADWVCSIGVTLIEIPASNPTYSPITTVTRFPTQALKDALLPQVQQMIPLIKVQALQPGYPAIYLSDRRCTVGAQLYLPRLVAFDGISQSMGNEADDATFTFGNADRVNAQPRERCGPVPRHHRVLPPARRHQDQA